MTDYDGFFNVFARLAAEYGFTRREEPSGRKYIHFVTGLEGFYYVASFEGSGFRIELELANKNLAQNQSVFSQLSLTKGRIQQDLGALRWVSKKGKACRIYSELPRSTISSDWDAMMTWGLKTLTKFGAAFSMERLRLL